MTTDALLLTDSPNSLTNILFLKKSQRIFPLALFLLIKRRVSIMSMFCKHKCSRFMCDALFKSLLKGGEPVRGAYDRLEFGR